MYLSRIIVDKLQFIGVAIENTSSVAPRHLPLKGKAYAKRKAKRFCSREKDFYGYI